MDHRKTNRNTLSPLAIFALALISCSAAHAGSSTQFDDWAEVVSSTPRYVEYHEHDRHCRAREVERLEPAYPHGSGGAVIGGLAGAIIGSQVGKGNGRVAAAAIGAATGAIVGDRIQRVDYTRSREVVWDCPRRHVERRVTGYDVLYEYRGRTYSTYLPYAPGERLRLQVSIAVQ